MEKLMRNEIEYDLIHKPDPNALYPVMEDRSGYYAIKRILDFLIALVCLVLLSPLMLMIAILIFLYSPGPIFYRQERIGTQRVSHNRHSYWKKENFICYKFRSMKLDADPSIHKAYVSALIHNDVDQMDKIQGKASDIRKLLQDTRVTRPGKLLRKFSLDELPQLWNVLRGEMSLVGPRPAILYEVEMYQPWHMQRLQATPGITGLQQVEARCTTDFDEQVRLDLEYIKKQSIGLDLQILLKTPIIVLKAKGAY
jgi:lipopolysaccharide/colanic/teichoic acid biosynthesis glycosyltransferase